MTINVLKSNGSLEPLNLNKILQWGEWAAKDCPDVSLESLLTTIPFSDGITTRDITIAICQKCEELSVIEANKGDVNLSEQYFKIARNLYVPNLIKRCNITYQKYLTKDDILSYGYKISEDNVVPLNRYKLKSILDAGVKLGIYNPTLNDGTIPEEVFDYADTLLDYSDMNAYFFCGLRQTEEKYLIKYNSTELFEDPLIQKMLMAIQCARSDAPIYPNGFDTQFLKETVLKQYLLSVKTKANDPSPFSTYLRTNHKQYDSCCLVELDDTADSINTAVFTLYNATTQGAGIGLSMGSIRANGTLFKRRGKHGGNFGYAKYSSTSIKATSQVDRGGSANTFFPIWHRDALSTMLYKDATSGAEGENRLRHLDYSFIYSGYLLGKYKNNEKILLTSPHTILKSGKTVYQAFFNVDENGFYDDQEFIEYCEDKLKNPDLPRITPTTIESVKPGIDCYVYAKDIWAHFVNQQSSTNRLYNLAIDHSNNHSPYLQPIRMSNLCVGEGTPVLTKDGVKPIESLEDQTITIWNGQEWTDAVFKKTNDSINLTTIKFSNGAVIKATDYHKFPVVNTRHQKKFNKPEVKRTHELVVGDCIAKFNTNFLLNFDKELPKAYTNGFYSGDGHYNKDTNKQEAWIYAPKLCVLDRLEFSDKTQYSETYSRLKVTFNQLESKFFVPIGFSIKSKIEWLAGILDADGTVTKNGTNFGLQIGSVEPKFLNDIRLMLLELGIESKVVLSIPSGFRQFPSDKKSYDTKDMYRIIISGYFTNKLIELGLNTSRLQLEVSSNLINQNQFITVTDIVTNSDVGPTWCCNEPKKNMFIIDGIASFQCMEILQPTSPISLSYDSKTNTYIPNDGEVSFCQLGAIVFGENNTKYEEIEDVCYWMLRRQESIFNISDYSKIPFSHKQKSRRNVGIGIANGQRLLVEEVYSKYPIEQWIEEASKVTHKYAEAFQYYLIKASVRLAKELGPCEDFYLTKYSKGILPIDTCTITKLNNHTLLKDWESLRKDVVTYGMRNSCLTACMPVESSSVEKQLTPYFEYPRKLVTYKGNKKLTVAVPVPDLSKYGKYYITAWDDTPIDKNALYLACSSNVNKFTDQSISYNSYFNLNNYLNRKIPVDVYMQDVFINPYNEGIRTHYYVNINTEDPEEIDDNVEALKQKAQKEAEAESCAGGSCKL